MAIMRYLVLLILVFQTVRSHTNILPAFLIDYGDVMSQVKIDTNPFSKITHAHFAYILQEALIKSEVMILFIEEELSVEDVSSKDKLGTPYRYLHKSLREQKVKYIPGIVDPYKTLTHMFKPHQFNVFYLSSGTKLKIFDGHFKYFYVYFKDSLNETRVERLRRHDLIMNEVYFVIRQLAGGEVVAFYTGISNPVVVQNIDKTQRNKAATVRGVIVESDSALFRFVGVGSESPTRRARFTQVPRVANETWLHGASRGLEPAGLYNKIEYPDFDLEFLFSFKDKEWTLDYVSLLEGNEEVGRTKLSVGAPRAWSYYCNVPLMIINQRDGSTVSISEYQIKPRLRQEGDGDGDDANPDPGEANPDPEDASPGGGEDATTTSPAITKNDSADFGNTVHCGPYYTAGIITCLFVSAICFGIVACGIMMMSDCKSNSKYDDAQGKPLTINIEGAE